jgi:hypothetical protein
MNDDDDDDDDDDDNISIESPNLEFVRVNRVSVNKNNRFS